MPGGYVLCEYDDVKSNFPEMRAVMETLEAKLIEESLKNWSPQKYGGIKPSSGEIGKSTIMPPLFIDNAGNTLVTWQQDFTALGHQIIMAGSGGSNTIFEDYMVGIAGFAVLDPTIRFTEIKMYIGDRKLGRINIEEMYCYEKPAIIFEDAYIVNEETTFEFYAFVNAFGLQRVKLLGLQMNRIADKMLTATGAALT